MLMEARAFNEGARALVLWGALQVDISRKAQTEEERLAAEDLLGLLTPVIKGYLTDKGYEVATNSQQVYGGHGYIREWGMEQFVRDARIAQIYEGTNGIQALDLVGRKLGANGGRAVQAFFKILAEETAAAKSDEQLAPLAAALEKATADLQTATMWLMQNGMANPNNAGAAAYPYIPFSARSAWLMCRDATATPHSLTEGDDRPPPPTSSSPQTLLRRTHHPDTGCSPDIEAGGRPDGAAV